MKNTLFCLFLHTQFVCHWKGYLNEGAPANLPPPARPAPPIPHESEIIPTGIICHPMLTSSRAWLHQHLELSPPPPLPGEKIKKKVPFLSFDRYANFLQLKGTGSRGRIKFFTKINSSGSNKEPLLVFWISKMFLWWAIAVFIFRAVITINAPLILKMRDIIFFAGELHNGPFQEIFQGGQDFFDP